MMGELSEVRDERDAALAVIELAREAARGPWPYSRDTAIKVGALWKILDRPGSRVGKGLVTAESEHQYAAARKRLVGNDRYVKALANPSILSQNMAAVMVEIEIDRESLMGEASKRPWTQKRSDFWWRVVFGLFGLSAALMVVATIIRVAA